MSVAPATALRYLQTAIRYNKKVPRAYQRARYALRNHVDGIPALRDAYEAWLAERRREKRERPS